MNDELADPEVTKQTLGAWRTQLVKIRDGERQRSHGLSAETGRLLETVGQVLAQGGGTLPSDDIARIEELTKVAATYPDRDQASPRPPSSGDGCPPPSQ